MLSDGSNGIAVDRRTRIRNQERAPVAADKDRREDFRTHVAEAHRIRSSVAEGVGDVFHEFRFVRFDQC